MLNTRRLKLAPTAVFKVIMVSFGYFSVIPLGAFLSPLLCGITWSFQIFPLYFPSLFTPSPPSTTFWGWMDRRWE